MMFTTVVSVVVALFHHGPQPAVRPHWWYTVRCSPTYCLTTVVVDRPDLRHYHYRRSQGA